MLIETVRLQGDDTVVWRAYGAEVGINCSRGRRRLVITANRRVRLEWAAAGTCLRLVVYMDEPAAVQEYQIEAQRARWWRRWLAAALCGSSGISSIRCVEIHMMSERLFILRSALRTPTLAPAYTVTHMPHTLMPG